MIAEVGGKYKALKDTVHVGLCGLWKVREYLTPFGAQEKTSLREVVALEDRAFTGIERAEGRL